MKWLLAKGWEFFPALYEIIEDHYAESPHLESSRLSFVQDHILKTDGFTGFTFPDEIDTVLFNRLMELLSCYPIIRGLPKIVQAIKIGHMLVSACRRFLNAKDGKRKKSTEKSDGKSNR